MSITRTNYRCILFGSVVCFCMLLKYCACAPQGYYYSQPQQSRRVGYTYNQPARTQQQTYYYPRRNVVTSPATTTTTPTPYRNRVNRADAENAKFAGLENLEGAEESEKSFKLLKKKKALRRYLNQCLPFGRDAAANDARAEHKGQGRFLFDVNVYNVYPGGNVGGLGGRPCGGYGLGGYGGGLFGLGGLGGFGGLGGLGGGGLGGGLLSDPVAAPAYGGTPLTNFLGLFAPGILQNAYAQPSLGAAIRPPSFDAYRPQPAIRPQETLADETNDLQSDPAVDPAYMPAAQAVALPVRRPNRIYYDSAGAPPVTPAQLVGGVATTVNGIIQQLTGSVQPVYGQSYRNTRNYG